METTEPAEAKSLVDVVREVTAARAIADMNATDAEQAWRDAIKAAVEAGERVIEIAAAAGISRDRVYQIRDGRR